MMLIDKIEISNSSKTYFIADIAANHDGDLKRAIDLIYLAAESGANAAKFQHFSAETIVSDAGFKSIKSNSHQSKWEKSVYEVYKDASVSLDWTEHLVKAAKDAGISFFTSPYSVELVDSIDPYVPAYKIGSGDITWIEIIEHIASKNKPYILASGASSFEDVIRAVNKGLSINNNMCLMQCNTNYTGDVENYKYLHLNVLKTYREMFPDLLLGLSDHTPGSTSVLGAIALGARVIEKHFTDDKSRKGPDHLFSMNAIEWKEMILRSRELESALGSGIKKVEKNEKETYVLQRRGIVTVKNLPINHILEREDLIMLRPCPEYAIPPYQIDLVLGRKLNKTIAAGEILTWKDLY